MRYSNNIAKNGKYQTSRYPIISATSEDVYIIAREGDRLDLLANEFYKDSSMWWLIADANNLGKGDLIEPAGKQIRIPVLSTLLQDKFRKAYEEK